MERFPPIRAVSVGSPAPTLRSAKMAEDYIWDIRKRVLHGREMYAWAVIECASGKTVKSGKELLHSSALKLAMKAIRQLDTEQSCKVNEGSGNYPSGH